MLEDAVGGLIRNFRVAPIGFLPDDPLFLFLLEEPHPAVHVLAFKALKSGELPTGGRSFNVGVCLYLLDHLGADVLDTVVTP